MERELAEREIIPAKHLVRKKWVHPTPLLLTEPPWVSDRKGNRMLGALRRVDLLHIPSEEARGVFRVVVAEHSDGKERHHTLLGIAADGARPDDPTLSYHPFTDRKVAKAIRRLVEQEEFFKQAAEDLKGRTRQARKFSIFDIRLPQSSVHGELLAKKLISQKVETKARAPRGAVWLRFKVRRFEIPGIRNTVPLVIGTYRHDGKISQAAFGVAAVGNRIIESINCPRHHRFLDEALAKTVQKMLSRDIHG